MFMLEAATLAGLRSSCSGAIGDAVGSTLSLGPPAFQAAGRAPGQSLANTASCTR